MAVEEHAKVVIIGSGFSGLGMAIRLKEDGVDDLVILERSDELGGTWNLNTYPGCTCDVPSHLYSFSFAPNPNWSQTYSPQPEIHEYLRECADRYAVRPHIRTGAGVLRASWIDERQLWQIETTAGTYTASVLVSAMGPLTEPRMPEVPGLESFQGKAMHSARWDHDYDLRGKTVASIGTGSSAIQYVPEICDTVQQLYVFQRTPPWVMPHGNRAITDFEREVYRRVPLAQQLVRAGVYASRELLVLGFAKDPKLMRLPERLARAHMRKHISDPELLRKVTPDYTIGCKRILPSNRWYPALARPNVELIDAGLEDVREHSVVDAHGVEREVDTIIFGTGYHVTDIPAASYITGRDGSLLEDVWEGSPRAYMGTAVPGFPNLFFLLGPNTGLGHSSMVYMIESQIEHVRSAIATLDRAGAATIEVRPEAHDDYNRELDARMGGTVWSLGGCSSYYLDRTGRNATIWPDWTWRFRQRAERFEPSAYALSAPSPELVTA
jgi:cation diffusion facilitator CzcD-associated flavoprotein CzcO